MANDTTIDVQAVKAGTEAIGDQTAALKAWNRQLQDFATTDKTMTRSLRDTGRGIKSMTRDLAPLATRFATVGKHAEHFITNLNTLEQSAGQMVKGMDKLDNAMKAVFLSGNKEAAVTMLRFRNLGAEMKRTTVDASVASQEFDRLSAALRKTGADLEDNRKKQMQAREAIERSTATYGENSKEVVEARHQMALLKNQQRGLQKEWSASETQLVTTTTTLTKYKGELLDVTKRTIETIKAQKDEQRELEMLQGGVGGLKASFAGLASGKGYEYLAKFGGIALAATALKMLDGALSQTASYYSAVGAAGLRAGDVHAGQAASAGEAQESYATLGKTAGELGDTLDHMTEIQNKIRLGVVMGQQGALGADAINKMTVEAARFAKVTGMDAGEAVALMGKQMHQMGLSGEEAVGRMQDMRVTIQQMTAANGKNNIEMAEMLKLIDEASDATQSYMVDTRLLTTALRGAANEAVNQGMSMRQAQDVSKSLGKLLGKSADYVEIPVGETLLNEFSGPNAKKAYAQLDTNTRKQVEHLMDGYHKGTIGFLSATREINKLIGGTGIALQAKVDQILSIYGSSSEAATMLVKEGMAENEQVAQVMLENLKRAKAIQARVAAAGGEAVDLGAAMSDSANQFKKSLEGITDETQKIDKLGEMGLNPERAKQYLDNLQKGETEIDQLAKDKKLKAIDAATKAGLQGQALEDKVAQQAALDRGRIQEKYWVKNTNLIARSTDPLKEVMAQVKEIGGKDKSRDMKLDPSDLIKGWKKGTGDVNDQAKDLAKRFGIDFAKHGDTLEKWLQGTKDVSSEDLSNWVTENKKTNAQELAALTAGYNKFKDGFLGGLAHYTNEFIAIQSPFVKIGAGLAAMAAILAGGKWLNKFLTRSVVEDPVYRALKRAGGTGGGGTGSDGSPHEGTEENRKKTDKTEKEALKRERSERLKEARDKGGKGRLRDRMGERWDHAKGSLASRFGRKQVYGPHLPQPHVAKGRGIKGLLGGLLGTVAMGATQSAMGGGLDVGGIVKDVGHTVAQGAAEKVAEGATKKVATTLAEKAGEKGLIGLGAKTLGKRAGGVVGGLVSGAMLYSDIQDIRHDDTLTEKGKKKASVKAVAKTGGGLAGGLAGAQAGAMAGGAVGALFGGVGAVPGAFIGGILGGALGAFAGEKITEGVTDAVQGGEDKNDRVATAGLPPVDIAGITGPAVAMPDQLGTLTGQAGQPAPRFQQAGAGGAGGATQLLSQVGPQSYNPDGSVTLKIMNFSGLMARYNQEAGKYAQS